MKLLYVITSFFSVQSGYTSRIISSDRPAAPIITLTKSEKVFRRQNLQWGVYPYLAEKSFEMEEYHTFGEKYIKEMDLAKKGDFIIFLSGVKLHDVETNTIVVHRMT